jgi:hypothetical protein
MASEQLLTGPSGTAAWQRYEVGVGLARPLELLLLPDVSNPRRQSDGLAPIQHVVLARPRLASSPNGVPIFSLTVVLTRSPAPSEALPPLIARGVLAFEATVAVPADTIQTLIRESAGNYVPLFAREGTLKLLAASRGQEEAGPSSSVQQQILAATTLGANQVRGALSLEVSAETVREILSGLDSGTELSLSVAVDIALRAVSPARTLRIVGQWSRIHADLSKRVDANRDIDEVGLRAAVDAMVGNGILSVLELFETGEEPLPAPVSDEVFLLFRSQALLILERLTGADPEQLSENRYRLASTSPDPGFNLDALRRTSNTSSRRLETVANLSEFLTDVANASSPREAFVRFVSLGGAGGVAAPIARRLPTGRAHLMRALGTVSVALARDATDLRAVGALIQTKPLTDASVSPASVLISDTTRLHRIEGGILHGWGNDLTIVDSNCPLQLPVVDDPGALFWRDRVDASIGWYGPVYEAVLPIPADDPATSPFLFVYERTGATSSAQAAIVASIRFTLRPGLSPLGLAAMQSRGLSPVSVTPRSPAVTVQLPFVDAVDGQTKTQSFSASVTSQTGGALTVVLELLNDWARLCYGALAQPGFQSLPLRVSVAYTFPAYVRLSGGNVFIALGGKTAVTPLVRSREEALRMGDRPHLDTTTNVLRTAAGELRLLREPASTPELVRSSSAMGARMMRATGTSSWRQRSARPCSSPPIGIRAAHPLTRAVPVAPAVSPAREAVQVTAERPGIAALLRPGVVIRPELRQSAALQQIIRDVEFAQQTVVRAVPTDLLFPCTSLGAFYQERTGAKTHAVGCRDALLLGRTENRTHEEMPELADGKRRVFRSLQQPGRFLVLPTHYRIARRAASAGPRAFTPAIALYAVLDPDDDTKNRVMVEAALEADLPPYSRRELLLELASYARAPELDYPTEMASDLRFVWGLPGGLAIEPQAFRVPNGLQASIATDIAGALLLRDLLAGASVQAAVTFEMPDGVLLPSLLELNLGQITGPWETGPFEMTLRNDSLELINRIERPVDLIEILVLPPGGEPSRLPVERRITPGSAHAVSVPAGTTDALPVFAIPPAGAANLEEIRSVIDEVTTNVIFLDLVNYAEHGLARLEIRARLRDVPGTYQVEMTGSPGHGSIDLLLPLTTYLSQRTLEFEVRKTFAVGRVETTPWLAWDLEHDGNVVSVTWSMLG